MLFAYLHLTDIEVLFPDLCLTDIKMLFVGLFVIVISDFYIFFSLYPLIKTFVTTFACVCVFPYK